MRIAVCSEGKTLNSPVDSRFGRCAYFVLVDTEAGNTECIPNAALDAVHGSGSAVVQTLADEGVKAVCAAHIGPNAYAGLWGMGIAMYRVDGSVSVGETVEAFKRGDLARHDAASIHPSPERG